MRRAKLHAQCVFLFKISLCRPAYAFRRPKLVGIKKKQDRREAVRERKALAAAHLGRAIEKELLERLKSKAYGDAPLNVNESVWAAILDKEKARDRGEELEDEETDDEEEELEGEVEEEWEEREFVSDVSESEDELSDLEHVMVSGPCFFDECIPVTRGIFEGGVDGSDYGEEDGSGDEDDDADPDPDAADKGPSKPAPKSKSTLGKRKAEFNPRKPKRECSAFLTYRWTWHELCVVRRWTSYRGRVRKRDGGRTESTGCCRLVVAIGGGNTSRHGHHPGLDGVRSINILFDINLCRRFSCSFQCDFSTHLNLDAGINPAWGTLS